MASLIRNGKNWGLIWTDSSRNPSRLREGLKTASRPKALKLKKQLEWGYENRNNPLFPEDQKHDPWTRKWYEDASIEGVPDGGLTISVLIEEFISYKISIGGQEGWSEPVADRETYVMRNFARHVGSIPIIDLSDNDLKAFYYRPESRSDYTRQKDRRSINTFLNWCISNGYLTSKPDYKVSKPQKLVPKFIYPYELARVIDWQMDYIKRARQVKNLAEEYSSCWTVLAWMMLAGTGMRPGELCNLKVSHIKNGYVDIGIDFTVKVREERRVPLLYEARQAAQILTCPNFRRLENNMKDSDYLLGRKPNYAATKLNRYFTAAWKACYPDSKRTLYNLKDMFAVRFLCDEDIDSPPGMRLNDLKEILGHASLSTTEKYLKAVPFGLRVEGTIWNYSHRKNLERNL